MLKTLLGRKKYEEEMSDEQTLTAESGLFLTVVSPSSYFFHG